MKIRELLEMGEELDSNQSGMGAGSATSGMGPMGPGAMGAMGGNSAQPMQTAAGSGVGPNNDWNPHTMGAPGSVPPFAGSRAGTTGPAGPPPASMAPQPGAPMKTAGMMDNIKNFMTTPQPIGDQSKPAQPSGVEQAIGNSSLNPFSPINKALQGSNQPPPKTG